MQKEKIYQFPLVDPENEKTIKVELTESQKDHIIDALYFHSDQIYQAHGMVKKVQLLDAIRLFLDTQ